MASKRVKYFGVFNRSILVMIFDGFCQKQGSFTFNQRLSKLHCDSPRITRCEGFTPENLNRGTLIETLRGFVITREERNFRRSFWNSLKAQWRKWFNSGKILLWKPKTGAGRYIKEWGGSITLLLIPIFLGVFSDREVFLNVIFSGQGIQTWFSRERNETIGVMPKF